LLDQAELGFQPVDVFFFGFEDVDKQLAGLRLTKSPLLSQ